MLGRMGRLNRDLTTAGLAAAGLMCAPERSCQRLRGLVKAVEDGPPSNALFSVLRKMAERDSLTKTIDGILADKTRCQSLARKSYHHTNNFDKIVLGQYADPDFEIRLHIWWDGSVGAASYDSDIHNHNWSFVSCILSGEFVNEVFEPDDNGLKHYHYRYSPREDKETFVLQLAGSERLRAKKPGHLKANETYFMPATSPHRFGPVMPTVSSTLLIQLPRRRIQSDVYRDSLIADQVATVGVPAFSVAEFRDRLSRYRKFVAAT